MMDKSPIYLPNYKPSFSGHESFQLRYGWLKNVYDAVVEDIGKNDTSATFDPDVAMARFGVGKNMVSSMRHWAICCGIIEIPENSKLIQLTDIAHFLFKKENGRRNKCDPFLEHPASLWLLHWLLAGRPNKTTWYWSFNHFRSAAFNRKDLEKDLVKMAKGQRWTNKASTIKKDVQCFLRLYAESPSHPAPEDMLWSPFHELGLIRKTGKRDGFRFLRGKKSTLGQGVFTYALIDFWRQYAESSMTLSFEAITRAPGSPGKVFLLGEDDVNDRLNALNDFTKGDFRLSESESVMHVLRSTKFDFDNALSLVERDYPSGNRSSVKSTRSAFDIDKALSEKLRQTLVLDIESVDQKAKLSPVVAKRHYHATGALRWLDMHVVFTEGLQERVTRFEPDGDVFGQLLFVIPKEGETDNWVLEICALAAAGSKEGRVAIGSSTQAWRIIDVARELNALERVIEDRPELSKSRAKRDEIELRQGALRGKLEEVFRIAIDDAKWCFGKGAPKRLGFFGLSERASNLADKLYDKTPRLRNELLNRINLTKPAKSGRDALIKAMVVKAGKARLGFEKNYPAALGMLSSLLVGTGLYREVGSSWEFCKPDPKKDSARLSSLWQATEEYLKQAKSEVVSVGEIYEIWSRRPFGVKKGVMPVLMVAYILSMRDNIEIHRNKAPLEDVTEIYKEFNKTDGRDFHLHWVEASVNSWKSP